MQLINAALDISALFDARKDVISRATRFTSKAPPRKIMQRIEEAVTALKGTTKRREASARYSKPCSPCQQSALSSLPPPSMRALVLSGDDMCWQMQCHPTFCGVHTKYPSQSSRVPPC